MLVLICTKCGSDMVDINGWVSENVAEVKCYKCQNSSQIANFTGARMGLEKLPKEAIKNTFEDVAIFHKWSERKNDIFLKGLNKAFNYRLAMSANDLTEEEIKKAWEASE